ncbi:MGMT family protein [Halobacillus yeomjeoni]|uniref:MGMT family protein n=1 Tax=Halobacillus yeomjeoni TaxID=311194 RepID=A0A931HVQ8_9BACI|nr:MGMT family protein [Halobacillus yeomjeoni]MBH0230424.1 MGMT family protein [Halobacillus yeomjeoni]
MKPFTQKTIQVIQSIPEGKVMTYGQIAREAGSPRAARQVVRILHTMSQKYNLPWHRVVNAQGEIAIKDEAIADIQRMELLNENVFVYDYKINLQDYQFTDEGPETQGPSDIEIKGGSHV